MLMRITTSPLGAFGSRWKAGEVERWDITAELKKVPNMRVSFERNPNADFLLEKLANARGGQVSCLESLECIRNLLFQVEAEVDFAHAAHERLMNQIAPADAVAFAVAGLSRH